MTHEARSPTSTIRLASALAALFALTFMVRSADAHPPEHDGAKPSDAPSLHTGQRAPSTRKPCSTPESKARDFDTKKQHIQRVYDTLSAYMIPKNISAPTLLVKADSTSPPYYAADARAIIVGASLDDMCSIFGGSHNACLAFFLGHELTHFTRGHLERDEAWDAGTGGAQRQKFSTHSRAKSEAQADAEGAFFAFLAGFNTLDISARALGAMYHCYGLNKNLSGYLPLERRKKVLAQSRSRVERLMLMFEVATFALFTERYELSGMLFDTIAADFAGQEILINAALSHLNHAQRDLAVANTAPSLLYPGIVVGDSRLEFHPQDAGAEDFAHDFSAKPAERKARRKIEWHVVSRINRAIALLDRALANDPEDFAALTNKTIAYHMLGDMPKARAVFELAREHSPEDNRQNKELLDTLDALIKLGEDPDPETLNQRALETQSLVLKLNAERLGHVERPPREGITAETLDGYVVRRFPIGESVKVISMNAVLLDAERLTLAKYAWADGFVTDVWLDKRPVARFSTSTPRHTKTANKLPTGAPQEEALDLYGAPDKIFLTAEGGRLFVYHDAGLILWFDERQRLEKWTLFLAMR